VYLPAGIGWLIFAPCFRAANWLIPNCGKYSNWFWCGVEAIDHENYYWQPLPLAKRDESAKEGA